MKSREELKKEAKKISNILGESREHILVTKEYTALEGDLSTILSLLSMIIKHLVDNGVDKELIQNCVDLACMETDKMSKDILGKLKEVLEELENEISD